jgi:hypothetical protein
MRVQFVRSIVVLLFCLFCAPRTAHADLMSFWEWLDRMSGPGPWVGVVSEWNPGVWGATKEAVAAAGTGRAVKTLEFDKFGTAISQRDFHVRYGPQIGYLRALYNDLDYGGAEPPAANAFVFGATLDAGAKGVEAGIAAGWVRFFGDGFGFTKTTIQPRITIYPFVALAKDKARAYADPRSDGIYIRIGANRIIGNITAADFGAIEPSVPQPMGDEWMWSIVVGVNPFALRR